MMNLVRGEFLKIRTTAIGPMLAGAALLLWVPALLTARLQLVLIGKASGLDGGVVTAQGAARDIYTAGMIPSAMVLMLLGVVVTTAEFQHRTATQAFLGAPRRVPLILAKAATVGLTGVAWWALVVGLNFAFGILPQMDRLGGPQLAGSGVGWGVAAGALACALWGVIGVGFGVLMRNQVAASIAALSITFVGTALMVGAFALAELVGPWLADAVVVFPTVATLTMAAPPDPESPAAWVGPLILTGWAVATLVVGATLLRRRDLH